MANRDCIKPPLVKISSLSPKITQRPEELASSYDQKAMVQTGMKQLQHRRLSSDSQDFEFNKLTDLSPHLMDQAGVASADELFYKGQLLPLQYNRRLQHSPLSACERDSTSSKLTLSSVRDQDVKFSSCRMDGVGVDTTLLDFRCSSFRLQSNNYSSNYCNYYGNYNNISAYWDSSTSAGGDSSSSSRDSNGSSQDSCYSENKEHCNGNGIAGANGSFAKRRPSFIQSWKFLFSGFKKGASNGRGDDHTSSSGNLSGPISSNPASLTSEKEKHCTKATPISTNQGSLACGKVKYSANPRPMRPNPSSWAYEREKKSTYSGPISTDPISLTCDKEKENRRAWASKGSRWHGYTKPISMIKATLVGGHENKGDDIENLAKKKQKQQQQHHDGWFRGRVTRPPLERRFSQPSLVSRANLPSSSSRFLAVSSSCPASVLSSPNHSGLLSPLNNTINMSTIQELHSAVQGAIAHCKQSISANVA